MFPIRPGEQNYLAGTMGELRSSHFHAGIDIKTSGVTGLPVYAAADGYISRIKIATGGYGNALYMLHPTGKSTVYAHLERYSDQIQEYVRSAQYKKESFEIELFPQKGQFSFKKGDVIGYSGNSGSSTGPHLHFEVRDVNQHVIDPLKYGFKEIIDDLQPIVSKVALKTMDIDSRINGQFGRLIFDVKLIDGKYVISEPINVTGKIGVQIYAYDRLNGAPNKNGIPCVEMLLDNEVAFTQNISSVSFGETRSVINHFDYSLWQAVSSKYNKLYIDNGTRLSFLDRESNYGVIGIDDTLTHDISIRLTDAYDNSRELTFSIVGSEDFKSGGNKMESYLNYERYEVLNNTLELTAPIVDQLSNITLYVDKLAFDLLPAYTLGHQAYYLWDMRAGIPDSADLCGEPLEFNFLHAILPGAEFNYYHKDFELNFSRRDLYDTLFLRYSYSLNEAFEEFHFQNETTPVQSWVKMTLTPKRQYDEEKSAVYTLDARGNLGFAGGEWKDGRISFNTRDFTKYTIATDTISPSIRLKKSTVDALELYIDDERSGIKSYHGELNGEWLLLNYDYKRKLLQSEKKSQNIPFEGEFILRVSDNAGNETIFTTKI
ncbi:MAG: M23 family metallopeptidase [Cyclobacteriaceae bacterium]